MSTNNSPAGMTGFTNFPNDTTWQQNKGEGERWSSPNSNRSLSGRGGFDYYFNTRNIVSLSYRITDGRNKTSGDVRTRMLTPEHVNFASFQQMFKVENKWGNQNLNLNYQNIFDSANNRQFFIDVSWVKNHVGGSGETGINHYLGNIAPDKLIYEEPLDLDLRLTSDIFSIKGDLEFPLNKETKLETGVKYSYVNNDNDQVYNVSGIPDPNMTNRYIYTENITSFYGMINHTFSPKTSVEVGLRYEHTALKGQGHNEATDSLHTNRYWGVFPSLNANQKLTEKTGLNFSYSYRLRRPNYTDLNPLITRNLAFEFNSGNPYLNPEFSHIFRLAYTYNHAPIVRLAYARSDGEIRRVTHYYGDTVINRPENLGRNDAINLQLMFQHTFFEKWRLLMMTGGEYSVTQFEYLGEPIKRDFFRGSYYISNDITLSKTMSLDVNSWGMFPRKVLFTKTAGMYSVNIGFKKSFFTNRSLTATVGLNDIFNTANKWTNETKLPTGQHHYQESYWASRSISFRLNYRFGKGNVQTRRMRDAANEEAGRMGDGGGQGGQSGGIGQ
jgi:hypothetical protein